ncbi:MAG: CapA family protein [Patescibacteria group bacterium]|nr:CapA family protein [Patescibacteria group bacterium]
MKNFKQIIFFIIIAISIIFCIFYLSKKNSKSENFIIDPLNLIEKISVKPKIEETPKQVSMIAVGDIMLSRGVASKIKKYKNFDYPFLNLKEILKSTNFNFANLESPIIAGRAINTGQMIFRADPGIEKNLRESNFQILSLANNHIPNFGDQGIKNTIELLNNENILSCGAGENEIIAYTPTHIEINKIKFTFLCFNDSDVVPLNYKAGVTNYGTAFMDIKKLQESIKIVRENSDFVIVSMHSGTEYVNDPNKRQIEFAHSAIDAGADLIMGHHPHVVQTIEKYQDKYIFYSLGNFIFDQMWSQETKEGLIVKFIFEKNKNIQFLIIPTIIEDYSQPRFANEKESAKILKRLKYDTSKDLNFLEYINEKKVD